VTNLSGTVSLAFKGSMNVTRRSKGTIQKIASTKVMNVCRFVAEKRYLE